jgi:hypothetical protein
MQLKQLDPEFLDEIMSRLADGCGPTMMCDTMRIPRSAYYNWLKEGEKPDNEPYTTFRRRIMEAKSDYLWGCVKDIRKAGRKVWQANAWLLERKDPDNFSEKHQKKEYPEHLKELPFDKQGNAIYAMMLAGEISQYEAANFVDILAKLVGIEENTKLKQELFEINEKFKAL